MTVVAPIRSNEQRMAALKNANQIRCARAAMKREMTAVIAVEMLTAPPRWLEGMKVEPFLLALPKWGPVRVRRTLQRFAISRHKTVAGLSDRQRGVLVNQIRGVTE